MWNKNRVIKSALVGVLGFALATSILPSGIFNKENNKKNIDKVEAAGTNKSGLRGSTAAPEIQWQGRTGMTSFVRFPFDANGQVTKLTWSQLNSVPLDVTSTAGPGEVDPNIWTLHGNYGALGLTDVPYAQWSSGYGNGLEFSRFQGKFTLPDNYDYSDMISFKNIPDGPSNPDGYDIAVDNGFVAFVYPYIDNGSGVNAMTDGDLTNGEITDSNFMSYFAFGVGTYAGNYMPTFNGMPIKTRDASINSTIYGAYKSTSDNTGSIIASTKVAYPDKTINSWMIELFAIDEGGAGNFPITFLEEAPTDTSNMIIVNYYKDSIDENNRIGYKTIKNLNVGDEVSLSSEDLNLYQATADTLTGETYLDGIQTGENPLKITADKDEYIINVLYTKEENLKPITVKYVDESDLNVGISGDTTGFLYEEDNLNQNSMILNSDKSQVIPVSKEIRGYSFNKSNYDKENGTLYLEYTLNKKTITYVTPAVVDSISPTTFSLFDLDNGNIQLENPTGDFNFEGWFKDSDFTEPITEISDFDDTTVYGKYTANIIFHNIIGELGEEVTLTVSPEDIPFAILDKVNPGASMDKIFQGFFTEDGGKGDKVTDVTEFANKDLYAYWLPNLANVDNGGEDKIITKWKVKTITKTITKTKYVKDSDKVKTGDNSNTVEMLILLFGALAVITVVRRKNFKF
ncbi:MAG: InlB B-repeat-containing protein [Lachnospiraceae bacterium]|jgi:hypothetical protein|nr:InlB B-repeat-containing protein [Lachnospiraceae bacterium]